VNVVVDPGTWVLAGLVALFAVVALVLWWAERRRRR
jgi:uncharacterized membrane protein